MVDYRCFGNGTLAMSTFQTARKRKKNVIANKVLRINHTSNNSGTVWKLVLFQNYLYPPLKG